MVENKDSDYLVYNIHKTISKINFKFSMIIQIFW